MLCAIFKSVKKSEMYLYVKDRQDLSPVPDVLLQSFGRPEFVMLFNLTGDKQLARIDNEKVKAELEEKGFYLQMPPQQENLLDTHKKMHNKAGE